MWGAQADPAGSTTVGIAGEGAHHTAFSLAAGLQNSQGAIYTQCFQMSNEKTVKQILSMFYTNFTTDLFFAILFQLFGRKLLNIKERCGKCDMRMAGSCLIFSIKKYRYF